MAKRRKVLAEYGFTLGLPRRTPEERDGYRRYMRDWRRGYREAHREQISDYQRDYRRTVTRKGFRSKAEASGDPKRIARVSKAERKRRLEERKREILEKYGFHLGKKPQTPEELAGWKRYKLDYQKGYAKSHKEKTLASLRCYHAKQKVKREEAFQKRIRELEATDPAKAAKVRHKYELLVRQEG